VAEAAVGGITGASLGHFGSTMATPDVSNASTVHGYRLCSNQNRLCIGFDNSVAGSTPKVRDFSCLHYILSVSEVECSRNGMAMLKTTPPDSSGYAVDCGIADLPLDDCSRMTAKSVVHQGIFANDFADEWTEPEPESQAHSTIIDHVIKVCDFSADSVMVECIAEQQEQWSTLAHVVALGLEEV
jgi:hypothetical protein